MKITKDKVLKILFAILALLILACVHKKEVKAPTINPPEIYKIEDEEGGDNLDLTSVGRLNYTLKPRLLIDEKEAKIADKGLHDPSVTSAYNRVNITLNTDNYSIIDTIKPTDTMEYGIEKHYTKLYLGRNIT